MKKTFLTLLLSILVLGCQSSSTDQENSSGAADIFVPTSENSGSIRIELKSDTMSVSDTVAFLVEVKDANGGPVEGIQVACDTEGDLALIEPTSGLMLTGPYGSASGVVGCEDTGSFMMVCRLPVGGNKRHLVRIKCEGDRPIGFEGFPNAGGGNLGNGVADQNNEDEDTGDNSFSVRLLTITYETEGEDNSLGIDTEAGVCGSGTTTTPEPFGDDTVKFKIKNETDQVVRFSGYTYTVQDYDGSGASYTSPELSVLGEALQSGQTGEFNALFGDAVIVGGGAVKRFYGTNAVISSGFKNITVTITGNQADGTPITVTGSTALSFDNFNNC